MIGRVRASLDRLVAAGLVRRPPNVWQVGLGAVRMWHRILFRSDTIGTSSMPVRATRRARWMRWRAVRLPVLLWEGAVIPLDVTGLATSPERLVRHLLAAHHDGRQFAYDLQILAAWPGRLEEVRDRARQVVREETPQARRLRDLVVFDGYHEALATAAGDAMRGDWGLSPGEAGDPDISLLAWLDWCASRPATPRETWAAWWRGDLEIRGVTRAA